MGKDCKAPEEFPGLPQNAKDSLGESIDQFAESAIFDDYVGLENINELTSIFPKRDPDGTQVFRDLTGLNTQLFIAAAVILMAIILSALRAIPAIE